MLNFKNFIKFTKLIAFIILSSFICLDNIYAKNAKFIDKADKNTDKQYATSHSLAQYNYADIIETIMPSVASIICTYDNVDNFQSIIKHEEISSDSDRGHESMKSLYDDFIDYFKDKSNIINQLYEREQSLAIGAGFVVREDGLLLTSYHLVKNANSIKVKFEDQSEYSANIAGYDAKTDLALLKINPKHTLKAVKFGDSDKIRAGDVVLAIGSPLGFNNTVTSGIISAKNRDLSAISEDLIEGYLQTDAAINSGNSGGPLINMKGEVIGVNTALISFKLAHAQGINFALPSGIAQNIFSKLAKDGLVIRTKLNILMQDLTEDLAKAMSMPLDQRGVLITEILKGGIGEMNGLKTGDLIIKVNSKNIASKKDLLSILADNDLGEHISIKIIRDFKARDIELALNSNKKINSKFTELSYNRTIIKQEKIGFMELAEIDYVTKNLNGMSADFKGVIVTNILSKVDADVQPGDIILSLNYKSAESINHLKNIYNELREQNKSTSIALIKRGNVKLFVAIPIDIEANN